MSGFSKEALKNSNNEELIAIIQEQHVKPRKFKHGRHEEHMGKLVAKVRKLTSSFAKLESE